MPKKKRHMPPFEAEITSLAYGGCGLGLAPDGAPVKIKFAAPGSRLALIPMGKRKGIWQARRDRMIRPPAGFEQPKCAAFGLCGGCTLQELNLDAQRAVKMEFGLSEVATEMGLSVLDLRQKAEIHPIRGAESGYHYRNKVELSFGPRRFLSEADHRAGQPIEGRYMGFHAAGRFDRVADVEHCQLIGEGMHALTQTLRTHVITGSAAPLWDARAQTGFWRHALLRRGEATGQHLVGVYTTSDPAYAEEVETLAEALMATALPAGQTVAGVIWFINDGVADVARGEVARVWGASTIEEVLCGKRFRLSATAFFQTSTQGAEVLYQTIREAVGTGHQTLYDLYCGTGSIGLALSDCAQRIVGVEEVEAAVTDALANAAENGVENASYRVAKMEKALTVLDGCCDGDVLVVDPPRAGLHPKVSARLAAMEAPHLVYVACKPSSLGRDARILEAGGWSLVEIWTVDLFPQTGHLEMVGRFERRR